MRVFNEKDFLLNINGVDEESNNFIYNSFYWNVSVFPLGGADGILNVSGSVVLSASPYIHSSFMAKEYLFC